VCCLIFLSHAVARSGHAVPLVAMAGQAIWPGRMTHDMSTQRNNEMIGIPLVDLPFLYSIPGSHWDTNV
jgi:hypothetical protein